MNIRDFIATFRNHPVLFVGTGLSLRYLQRSFTWDGLLRFISTEFKGNDEYYLDVKSKCGSNGSFKFDEIAAIIENDFNEALRTDRDGKLKEINDVFYENMRKDVNISRLKRRIQGVSATERPVYIRR